MNKHGYLIDDDGNIINRRGRKVLDKCYLGEDGEFPEMYNMRAKPFKMTSIMGELQRDEVSGDAVQSSNPEGDKFFDKTGRPVNKRGFLIDRKGNIINKNGEIMFRKN